MDDPEEPSQVLVFVEHIGLGTVPMVSSLLPGLDPGLLANTTVRLGPYLEDGKTPYFSASPVSSLPLSSSSAKQSRRKGHNSERMYRNRREYQNTSIHQSPTSLSDVDTASTGQEARGNEVLATTTIEEDQPLNKKLKQSSIASFLQSDSTSNTNSHIIPLIEQNVNNSTNHQGRASGGVVSTSSSSSTTKSFTWNFFIYDSILNQSSCKIAPCFVKLVGKNTTNLKRHLQTTHPEQYNIVKEKDRKSNSQNDEQPKISFSKNYSKNSPKQQQFIKALTWWIGSNPIPNSVVANEDFQNVIKAADQKLRIPSRVSTEKRLNELHQECKSKIKNLLKDVRRLTLSSDIWTKKGMTSTYLGINGTFYHPTMKKKMTVVLAVQKFETATKKAQDVLREMKKGLEEYNISANQVWRAMTDSGSEMVCAHKDQEVFLNNFIRQEKNQLSKIFVEKNNGDDEWTDMESNPDDDIEFEDDISESDFPSVENPNYDSYGVLNNDNSESEFRRLPCFIHKLLNCLSPLDTHEDLKELSERMRSLVSTFTTSANKTKLLIDLADVKLVSFNNTRKWHVTYEVSRRLLRVRAEILKVLTTTDCLYSNLEEGEWEQLSELKLFLEPFYYATMTGEKEVDVIASSVVVTMKELFHHLDKYKDHTTLKNPAESVKSAMESRFMHWLQIPVNSTQKFEGSFLIATLFDPRYRLILSQEEINLAKATILREHSAASERQERCSFERETQIESPKSLLLATRAAKLKARNNSQGCDNNKTTLANELDMFLNDESFDFLIDIEEEPEKDVPESEKRKVRRLENKKNNIIIFNYWENSNYRELAPLALDYLSLPMSSADVERDFSYGGIATCGRRNRLEGTNLDREIFLSKNKKILKDLH